MKLYDARAFGSEGIGGVRRGRLVAGLILPISGRAQALGMLFAGRTKAPNDANKRMHVQKRAAGTGAT